jgi:hypothetical protein
MTTKSFDDNFTIYLMDDTPRTISKAFAFPIQMIGKKWSVVIWTQFSQMELWSWLIDHMFANLWVTIGSSKRSLG